MNPESRFVNGNMKGVEATPELRVNTHYPGELEDHESSCVNGKKMGAPETLCETAYLDACTDM